MAKITKQRQGTPNKEAAGVNRARERSAMIRRMRLSPTLRKIRLELSADAPSGVAGGDVWMTDAGTVQFHYDGTTYNFLATPAL